MKILPIQSFSNYSDNKQINTHKNLQTSPIFKTQFNNINFNGIFDVFKRSEKKFYSKQEVLERLKEIEGINYQIQQIVLYVTENVQKGYLFNKYYKYMVDKIVELSKDGFKIENLFYYGQEHKTLQQFDAYVKRIEELKDIDYPKYYVKPFLNDESINKEQAQLLLEVRQKGYEKRDILSYPSYQIEDDELDDLFLSEPRLVLNTIKLLGKDSFISTFSEKYDNVENNIANIGHISNTHPLYQNLLELTNPIESDAYIKNQELIKELKSKFNKTNDKTALIKEINDLTNKNKNLVAKSIKAPIDKTKVAHIFNVANEMPQQLKFILRHCNIKTKKNKLELANVLDNVIKTDKQGIVCKQLNFKKNKYLTNLFVADGDFWENFQIMLEAINQLPKDNVETIFYKLPLNKNTKTQFNKLGVNFDKWFKYNPNSKVQKEIRLDDSNRKQNVIKNLEEDLSMIYYEFVDSINNRDNFFDALAHKGYTLKEQKVAGYDENGFLDENKTVLKLYKNNHPVEFDELPLLFSTIKNFIANDSLWNTKSDIKAVENDKNTIKNHILNMRFKEMRSANQKLDDESLQITVQKVDMNNVEHALFLGNHSSCCTAVGSGCNQWTAPNYVLSKMISAIEILDGKEPIGNTMCYIAEVDGKPSLILDNIELQAKYQYNDEIRDMLIEYAKKMTAEIGKPDMPIYAGPNRHKVDFDNFELINKDFRIIGSTGKGSVYLDFDADEHEIDGTEIFNSELYKIR